MLFQGKPFAVLSQTLPERKSKKSFMDMSLVVWIGKMMKIF